MIIVEKYTLKGTQPQTLLLVTPIFSQIKSLSA